MVFSGGLGGVVWRIQFAVDPACTLFNAGNVHVGMCEAGLPTRSGNS